MKGKSYAGIDYFRIVAALLVVAIHTEPLESVNATADFILTRVIGRTAVPFFFMASGFFLNPMSKGKLKGFLKKTAAVYGAATVLYLPIRLKSGIPQEWMQLPGLIKDLFVDGIYLHLWYLPAAMLGAAICWALLRSCKEKGALVIALLLYIVGLLGDSYYGFAQEIPEVKTFYQAVFVFVFSDYTRNGLFFAPVFFVLGALMARRHELCKFKTCLLALGGSLALMMTEALLLRKWGVQRHDSMYIMLVPCMALLFQSLLWWKGRAAKELRDISAAVYIIHPMVIAVVYKLAAVTKLHWLSHYSVSRFVLVVACSIAAAIIITTLLNKMRRRKIKACSTLAQRAWAQIDLKNLCHNAQVLQQALPEGGRLMAVVKANAYGHGDIEVSKALNGAGVDAFAVATLEEGVRLRKKGIKGEILVLGYTDPQKAALLSRYRLSQTIVDAAHAEKLNSMGKTVRVHIKIDTGMHRLGESSAHTQAIAQMCQYKHLRTRGIYTHLCAADSADERDVAYTKQQIQRFFALLEQLKKDGVAIPAIHLQGSYGILNYPDIQCGYARAGLALYGAAGSGRLNIELKPVLSLKARVALVRTVAAGESVGYGTRFSVERDTRIAVIPMGYADGIPSGLGNGRGCVLLHGCRAPIVGRICMDQLFVDVTDIPEVKRGDIATLIGCDGTDKISAQEAAANARTIANELLSRLGSRIKRIYAASMD